VWDKDDRYGFLTTKAGGVTNFLFSGGEKFTAFDPSEGNKPVFLNNNNKIANILQKTIDILHLNNATYTSDWDVIEKMFIANQGLFYSEILTHARRLREMDADFGILPCPKYDEAQKDYLTHIDPYSPIMCVPATADKEFVSIIIEALSAESSRTVTPMYIESSLKGRTIRDDESEEMLDIIFEKHVFDFNMIFDFGGIATMFNKLANDGKNEYISGYDSKIAKAISEIDKIWGEFDK